MKILVRTLQAPGVLIVAAALYLLTVGLSPGITAPPQPLRRRELDADEPNARPITARQEVEFQVDGTRVAAWLYLPELPEAGGSTVPCIVMAHGLGGTREMGLDFYAREFQAAGYAVLAFDYRHFGASSGEPRQLIWIPQQLADWTAAIAFARSLPEVDPARIAVWGASLGGGHAIVAAAHDHRIACVVAMCPAVDGRASAEMMFQRRGWASLPLIVHAQRDLVRSWLRLSPHKIPIVGSPGTVAIMTMPAAQDAFARLAPDGYVNEACARIVLRGDKYRPLTHIDRVRCAVLLQICDNDEVTPASAYVETVRRLGSYAVALHYPIGHFDIYFGEHRAQSMRDQRAFLKRYLG